MPFSSYASGRQAKCLQHKDHNCLSFLANWYQSPDILIDIKVKISLSRSVLLPSLANVSCGRLRKIMERGQRKENSRGMNYNKVFSEQHGIWIFFMISICSDKAFLFPSLTQRCVTGFFITNFCQKVSFPTLLWIQFLGSGEPFLIWWFLVGYL